MIFTERTIMVVNDSATINKPLILYRGDKNIELKITIAESQFKFRNNDASNVIETTDASYAQLVINTPYGLPIFSDVAATKNGAVIFVITEAMIDEIREVGAYEIQIRLLDDNKQSRASIPPVSNAIEIREPIAIEDGSAVDSNVVNVAKVNRALTTTSAPLEAFDSQGNYIKKTWGDGDPITDAALNKMEAGIEGVNNKAKNIPTNLSQLTNDANFVNETFVNDAIAGITGVSTVEPAALDMPKVFFYGSALPTTKDNVNLTMDYISNTAKFSSFIKLKCQGTSSMSYAKKNFTVSMFGDETRKTKLKKDFKGWGTQSKFCLKANYVDTTHTRNLSGARIAYDMVQSRPDSPFKQQLLTAPRYGVVDGFPIKVYFNGEFYGIYTWNIPKDGWMFNMDDSNPNHMVLCAEKNNDSTNTSDDILRCEFRKEWDGTDGNSWSIEFGTYSDALKNSFNRCVNFVMSATDEEFKANIGNYFDLYSLLDYYCFSYLVAHIDGLAKNMLMVTYDGVIWGATLYDMDSIYGADWQGTPFKATNIQCPEQYQDTNSLLWQRIESCFPVELYARYRELRQGALSLSNIIKHVEEIYDVIPDRVFADEKAKWTSLPGVNINTMTRFRNYMRDRAVYVDAQMQEIGTKVPCTGIVLSADTLSFTTTDTQTVEVVVSPSDTTDTIVWSVEPAGIVTVDNGVVTPLVNGTCTITATCGSYSDTCSVTVSLSSVECTAISLDKTELALGSASGGDKSPMITTAQLTATVSPTNCTQPVVWSVSPEGVVTVVNGLVTAVTNGEATVTATCGTQSANCAVTVSGMSEGGGDTGEYTDIGYIESTGTQYINTHIVPTLSTKIELVADMTPSKQYDHIFGSDNFMKVQFVDNTGTEIYVTKKNAQNQISGLTLGKHTYVMDMTDTANVITIDGANYANIIGSLESTTSPLLLLSGYNNGTIETEFCGVGKIYSCKIYYEDTLVANMKPILTNSGTYGLLDTVNNTFYGSEVGSFTGGNTNYLADASWQNGTININATGMTGSTDDKYTSVQIPAGRYTLTSTNATLKKYRLSDSEGNVISHNDGSNDTNDIIIDTTIYDGTIFTLEVSYYKPDDTIEVPSLTAITTEGNVITLTLDGSLNYAIPDWAQNPSGENGQVNVEYIISDINIVPTNYILKGYTRNNNLNGESAIGLAKQYMVNLWDRQLYLSFTLDMAETGVTNDVESITNYLSSNPLTFKYVG